MSDEFGVWAYAITEHGAADVCGLTGVGGAQVRPAPAAGLTVLVSDVDLAEYGEAALRRNLEDLAWLEQVARAHHYVIEEAARLFPVLPMRLATVYSSDAGLAAALDGRREDLHAALRRVGGRVEWGVKAYAAAGQDDDGRVRADEPDASDGTGGGAGLAYLRRRRAQLSARHDARRSAAAGAQAVHADLSGHAERARLYPPQAAQHTGNRDPMLLNAAYLLEARRAAGFASAVEAAAAAHDELRVELTGPWPPYSFTGETEG
jgi:hypothetical protein